MKAVLRRLESERRWWAAEAVLRGCGLALLALGAAATAWLYRSAHTPPPHEASLREFGAALVAVVGWCLGWVLLLVGQSLFALVPVPGGFTTISFPSKGDFDDRPDVARHPGRAGAADVRLPAPVRESVRRAA